ncbi:MULTISPECIES: DUF6505 family protein [unclassified Sulfitobacter]|jgi:Family of unknown function (DUF6505)|uniref:DUF6505 family protein n=1 Tax=unclassified Sulfitobacter TaxID=196795 RepID=UPI0007C35595|nr:MULTISPECIES: DUF6505 family protein [unclassified Sulfitobacter]KZY06517.1 hypothetical protein A3721_01450 [Sulfitobacter sp. HI0023]KZY27509.1 hypothetical protein A3728_12260 [Sulfitobacter sp. HI0040]KZZ63868.1 hypothetical protein A3764_00525 [Sulfitobacter sp. HI0129]MAM25596.1 hypothetical protein [Paracoccaceae bacterium]
MSDLFLARAIHFDESDRNVFHVPARTGEWCVSGGFEFSNWSEADLTGKARQAFTNGWLGVETFGRVTFVAVTKAEPFEVDAIVTRLAHHFVDIYGAPSVEAARPVAEEEVSQMMALCSDQSPNTLITVTRELTDGGVRESYRSIEPQDAGIEQFAVHGSLDDDGHGHSH